MHNQKLAQTRKLPAGHECTKKLHIPTAIFATKHCKTLKAHRLEKIKFWLRKTNKVNPSHKEKMVTVQWRRLLTDIVVSFD